MIHVYIVDYITQCGLHSQHTPRRADDLDVTLTFTVHNQSNYTTTLPTDQQTTGLSMAEIAAASIAVIGISVLPIYLCCLRFKCIRSVIKKKMKHSKRCLENLQNKIEQSESHKSQEIFSPDEPTNKQQII